VALFLLHFYLLFCKGPQMMGSDKIHTASCTYIHVLSLCHLYPLLVSLLEEHKWEFSKDTFLMQFFSQLYT
jgi:hypothetical protein